MKGENFIQKNILLVDRHNGVVIVGGNRVQDVTYTNNLLATEKALYQIVYIHGDTPNLPMRSILSERLYNKILRLYWYI